MRKLITLCFLIVSIGLNAQVLYDTTYFVSIDTQDTIIIDGASVLSVDTLELGGVKYTTITGGGGGGTLNLSGITNGAILRKLNDTIFGSDTLSYVNYNLNIEENRNYLIRNSTDAVSGIGNILIGYNAGRDVSSGTNNLFVGTAAGPRVTTGAKNTFTGAFAGHNLTTGDDNVFLGALSGFTISNGNGNTFVGYEAGEDVSDGDNNLFIGNLSGAGLGSTSDKLIIETHPGGSSDVPLLYGDFAADTLQINGDLKVTGFLEADSIKFGDNTWQTTAATGGGGGGNVDLSWGNNTGVLFETNDTINVSDNNYISGDDLYSTGYHYFDASDKFYISTEPASGNVMYVNNDGTNVLQFGSTTSILRSPTGSGLTLLSDELRMTFDSYNFANATNSQNFVTIESASGAGRVNLLGITRPGSAFSGLVVDTNLILTSDTSIYADYIKIDSVGFADGSWQSTASTGGGGSSSGSAGEIQYSDGSGGFDSYPGFFVDETASTAGAFQLNNTVVSSVDSSIAYNGNFYAPRFVAGINTGGQFYLGESGFSPAFYRPTSYSGSSKKVHLSGGFSNWHTGTDAALKIISTNFNGYALEIGRSETYGTYTWRIGNYGNVDHSSGNYYLADTLEVGENVYVEGHIESDSIYVDGNVYVEGYIEADSIVLINNTYSDIAFEDSYELINIKDAVEYAYQNGSLKGMDRDGMINPVSYINDLELKIEDLYLYTYKQQLEIERLRNLIMITFLIISVVAVSLFYRHLLR